MKKGPRNTKKESKRLKKNPEAAEVIAGKNKQEKTGKTVQGQKTGKAASLATERGRKRMPSVVAR